MRFSLDGADFEIDLTTVHAAELRDALAKYIAAGRKSGKNSQARTTRGSARKSVPTTAIPDPSEVREWAKNQGIAVSDRGRVANELVVRFQAAKG